MPSPWSLLPMNENAHPVNMIRRGWLSSLLGLLVSACRPVSVLNAIIPSAGMVLKRDVAYGAHARQRLDIYQPRDLTTAPLPVVLFFYGGSWDSGSKQDYLFVAEALTSQGFMVVIADYRLYPEVKFPQLMQDPASAVFWLKQHIADYQGDPARLFLMGHSAGAHLAMMLSLNASYLAQVGLQTTAIAGTVGLAGPYDFLPLTSARLRAIFAPPEQVWTSQPIHFAHGQHPPLLLMAGLKDHTVWPRNTINLAQAVEASGGNVTLKTYAGYDHVDMVAKLARPFRSRSPLLDDITVWMRQYGG